MGQDGKKLENEYARVGLVIMFQCPFCEFIISRAFYKTAKEYDHLSKSISIYATMSFYHTMENFLFHGLSKHQL